MITKDKILELITEEKNNYNSYSQLCSSYGIKIDNLAEARHSSKIEILELILKMLIKQ